MAEEHLDPALNALAALVRSRTNNGKDLVELMYRIARGRRFRLTSVTMDGVMEVRRRPSIRDRIDAAAWLAARGWGKAKDDYACAPARPEKMNRPAAGICLLCRDKSPELPTSEQVERWMVAHAAVRHPEALETFRRAIINGSTRLGG